MKTKMMKSIATLMLSITVATTMACSNPVEENADEETSSVSENTESNLDISENTATDNTENTATDNTEKSNDVTITISKEHNDENVKAYGPYASCDTTEYITDEDTLAFAEEMDYMLGKAIDNYGDTQATYDDFAVLHDKYLKPSTDPNDPGKFQEVMIYSEWDEDGIDPERGVVGYVYLSLEDPNGNNVPLCDSLSLTAGEYVKNNKLDGEAAVKDHYNFTYACNYAGAYIDENLDRLNTDEITRAVYFGHTITEGIEMLNTSDEPAVMFVPLYNKYGAMVSLAIFNNVPSRYLKQ